MMGGEGTLWGNFLGVVVHGETNDQIMPKERRVINAFSSNLNTLNFSATMFKLRIQD